MKRVACRLWPTGPVSAGAAFLIAFGAAPTPAAHARGLRGADVRNAAGRNVFRLIRQRPSLRHRGGVVALSRVGKFPDGLTVSDAHGQWRSGDGRIYREATHVLVILYKADATTDGKIEAIREAYKKQFHQENLPVRVDSTVCATFLGSIGHAIL
jgi:hypothetical protein